VKIDVAKVREAAEKDYEKTWVETSRMLLGEGRFFTLAKKGRPHPLNTLVSDVRKTLLELGFTEVIVPIIVDKNEVYAQYGPEAPVILDRVFFLAGLPRPDIGISRKKLTQLQGIVPGFKEVEGLKEVFKRYKRGEVESDNLVETLVQELGIGEAEATRILAAVFPELRELKPIPSDLTLRSHTTAGWFTVLREMLKREPLPLQLFSIGSKFRREQRLDPTHLYDSLTASIVVMAEEFSLEDGRGIAAEILEKLGFKNVQCVRKAATSKYYAQQTEFEVNVTHPKTGQPLEVGDMGFYSPIALSNYGIPYPVFNFGFGLERLLMAVTGEEDIREVVYPYLYRKVTFTDGEIADAVGLIRSPETGEGRKLVELIRDVALKHAGDPTPSKVLVYEGAFLGRTVTVSIHKEEAGKRLLGPAAFNPIVVENGNIVGQLPGKVTRESTQTSFTYLLGIANLSAYEAEQLVKRGGEEAVVEVKIVKSLSDVNLKVTDAVRRYIESTNRRIDVRGPVFITVKVELPHL